MPKHVLVAYASLHGSTRDVAEAVAETLRDCGLQADCVVARDVRFLAGYDAVVLGAAIYIGRLHKDARHFLRRYQWDLSRLPVAIFALGPFHDEEKEWRDVRGQLTQQLAKYPWLDPLACEIFGGVFDPAKLRFPFRLLPALRNLPPSDIRNWPAIRTWAKEVAAKLQPTVAVEQQLGTAVRAGG